MTKPEIMLPAPMSVDVMAALDDRFVVHRLWELDNPNGYITENAAAIRGMAVSTLAGRVGTALFSSLPALEIVANFGVGYDNIDVAAAVNRGIVVTNTPGVLDDEVADLTVGLLLATLRQIPQADRYLREGRWSDRPMPLSTSLRGRRIGILGLGAIGKAVARRLDGFGVNIAYHNRSRRTDVAYVYHHSPVALAAACDVLIVAAPGGAATRHMVDGEVLAALGREGVLINVSRGSVVDEDALIRALQTETILTAGLDVFANEPDVPNELREMPHAVLLPHIGSASERTRAAMGALVVDNLVAWFDTGEAITPVPETTSQAKWLGHYGLPN